MTGVSDTAIPEQTEEANPFTSNAESFAPYNESISAISVCQLPQSNVFGTIQAIPVQMVISTRIVKGELVNSIYETIILYTSDNTPVTVQTP